jgi:hypothetical protein
VSTLHPGYSELGVRVPLCVRDGVQSRKHNIFDAHYRQVVYYFFFVLIISPSTYILRNMAIPSPVRAAPSSPGSPGSKRVHSIPNKSSTVILFSTFVVMFVLGQRSGDMLQLTGIIHNLLINTTATHERRNVPSKNIYKRRATADQCRNARSIKFATDPTKAEKLRVPSENAKTFALGGYEQIAQGSGDVNVNGLMTLRLSQIQHSSGIYGSVGEVGVHHGRFTGCLFLGATANEDLVVGDIFEQQEKNVDGSGYGNKQMFMKGLTTYGLSASDLRTVHTGSTDEIPFDWSSSAGFSPFRMFSVDAGHTAALTFNDLEIAFCNLLQGGIVVLDDIFHPHWVGVTEGLFDYFLLGLSRVTCFPFYFVMAKCS